MTEREPAVFVDCIVYPIEIRSGVTVRLQLPRDLTKAEAEKIGRVVLALGDGERASESEGK